MPIIFITWSTESKDLQNIFSQKVYEKRLIFPKWSRKGPRRNMRFLCLLNMSWGFKRLGNNNSAYVSVPEALGLLWTVVESTKPGSSRKWGNSYYPLRSERSLGRVTPLSRGSESSSALQDPLLSTLSSSRQNAEFNGFSIMDIHTPLALLSVLPRAQTLASKLFCGHFLFLAWRVNQIPSHPTFSSTHNSHWYSPSNYSLSRKRAWVSSRDLQGAQFPMLSTEEPGSRHVSPPKNWFTGNAQDGEMCDVRPRGFQQLHVRKFPGRVSGFT